MSSSGIKRPVTIWIASILALIFGVATLRSAGLVLFTEGEFHQQQGNYVPFVVWFNFVAGFAYIAVALGLFWMQRWAAYLAYLIVAATALVFILFGVHVSRGGLYEMQTVAAMTIRLVFWMAISALAYYKVMRVK